MWWSGNVYRVYDAFHLPLWPPAVRFQVEYVLLKDWGGSLLPGWFWSHVHPIWHTIQELFNGSRFGNGELPSRNILVHVITVIVKVHFTIFIAVNRRWTWNTCSSFGTKNHKSYTISYSISGTIFRTLQKDRLCTLDIVSISKENLRYRVRYSNSTLFVHSICIRYRSFYSISSTISNCNIGI